MTLPLNSRLSALYDTNGTQKDFSFGFRVFFDPDNGGYGLEVRRQTADGYEVIPKSDYLVLPVEDNSAGVVRFSVAPSAGQQIYIAGKTPTIQQLVLTNFGRYSAESIETQFDFITAIIQEWLSALGEETRQRIAADEILTQYVVQRIDAFVQQVNQNFDDKSQEIEDYIATIMPSFTQTLRDEIEAYAVAGMQDAIDQTLAESKAEIDDAVARANAAATAAAITGKVYDTPEAGVNPVTGVQNGAYYNVRSPDDESYLDEYQNVGGSAVATGKSYPSGAALNAVKEAIIDPVTGKAMASKVFGTDGENLEDFKVWTKTYLDNFPFYIHYSPLVSDYSSQFKIAIQSGRPIVLTKDAGYPFLTPVNAVVTSGVTVHGNNATLSYDGASHIGDFIKIASSVAVKHYFYLTHVDGKHKATRCLYVESSQNNSDGESEFYFNNSSAKRAKRKSGETFLGGSAVHVRGAFKQVVSEYSRISECMLGTGAGTPGSVGINGFAVTFLTQTSYPLELRIVGGRVEKVYSEDPAYTGDQDGVLFFSAVSSTKSGKVRSLLSVEGAEFRNCWGRSIKSQCRNSVVTANNFFRNEGNNTFHGNTEVDIQVGQGEIRNNTYEYENGHTGGNCVGFGADANVKRGSVLVTNNEVYLDAATTLPVFITSIPRDGKLGVITCTDNKIFGKVVNFARLYVRGGRNIAVFKQNYTESIELDGVEQRNFIEVRASGSVAGETNFINIDVENNINDGIEAALIKDDVPNVGISTLQSGRNNLGFMEQGAIATVQGQKTFIPFRASGYASKDGSVLYSSASASIATGATQSFTLPSNATLLNIQMRFVPAASAVISNGANGALMSQVGTGNVVYSGGTTEPTTQGAILTIWRDANDTNKLNVKNNTASSRFVSIHFFTS